MACGSQHPEVAGVRCAIGPDETHENHYCRLRRGEEPFVWPNLEFVPPPKKEDKGRIKDEFDEAAKAVKEKDRKAGPIVGTNDPWPSHVAALRVMPTVGTRKALVLARLQATPGVWVSGVELATAEIGGSEGLKRLRELRGEDGWPIEERPDPSSKTAWQYRLVDAPPPLRDFD